MGKAVDWNDKNLETLKKMAADGHSGAQIARAIPGATRSGVLGKATRMGIKLDGKARISAPKPDATDEAIARELYANGVKVPTICNRFGGKYSIDTLSRLLDPTFRQRRTRAVSEWRAKKAPTPRPEAEPVAEPATPAPLEPLDLPLEKVPTGGCWFPTSSHDAPANAHRFCGVPAASEGPYCPHHHRIATGGLPVKKKPGAPLGR